MRVLFWVEPHFELNLPFEMSVWRGWFRRLAHALEQKQQSFDYRFAELQYPSSKGAVATSVDRVISFSYAELTSDWSIGSGALAALENDSAPQEAVRSLEAHVRERMSGFEPEFIFLLNEHPWLRRVFPNATFINIELSWISRDPFPFLWHLDVGGAGKGRYLADNFSRITHSVHIGKPERRLLKSFRSVLEESFSGGAEVAFVEDIRKKFDCVSLVPLGVYPSLDGLNSNFSVLDQYFSEQGGQQAFILTQHPNRRSLADEHLRYLIASYPNVFDGAGLRTQAILPTVDEVLGDFSSVAIQALFYGVDVRSLRPEILCRDLCPAYLNPLAPALQSATDKERDAALYWLLTRYAVDESRLFDGDWLGDFLIRARDAFGQGELAKVYDRDAISRMDWETGWSSLGPSAARSDSEASGAVRSNAIEELIVDRDAQRVAVGILEEQLADERSGRQGDAAKLSQVIEELVADRDARLAAVGILEEQLADECSGRQGDIERLERRIEVLSADLNSKQTACDVLESRRAEEQRLRMEEFSRLSSVINRVEAERNLFMHENDSLMLSLRENKTIMEYLRKNLDETVTELAKVRASTFGKAYYWVARTLSR